MNFDAIYNYHENLVFDAISHEVEKSNRTYSQNEIEDIACIALNALPSRYVRHAVDTVYFQSDDQRISMDRRILDAVKSAIDKVNNHPSLESESLHKSA